MARKAKVWWWKARKRWAANLQGKRYVAPAGIGEADTIAAGKWYERMKSQAATVRTGDGITFATLCDLYLEWDERRTLVRQRDPVAHRNSRSVMTTACKAWAGPTQAGDIRIDEFTAGHVQAMVNYWISDGLSPLYVRELASATKRVFRWACRRVDMRGPLLEENPVKDIELPAAPQSEPRFADRWEAAAWLRWLRRKGKHPDYARLQRCLIHTGARPSEWTRATWGDMNWSTWQLVRKEWKSARKTNRPRRVIVPRRLRRMLRRMYESAGRNKGARLFGTPRGLSWTSTNLSTITQRYREEAIRDGLPLTPEGPDRLTCYRWRHTAASSLLMDGVDMATVAEILGTSVNMIQKVYGHILDSHLAQAAERLANRR